ncbi:MAG: hypothetical protein HBSAPP04_01090 [Ignavibacteriaceae bacterium]|nr:MAG: hypothetical protein HBSAPP04_01090 [Ignavibacteriaceae bacterium]
MPLINIPSAKLIEDMDCRTNVSLVDTDHQTVQITVTTANHPFINMVFADNGDGNILQIGDVPANLFTKNDWFNFPETRTLSGQATFEMIPTGVQIHVTTEELCKLSSSHSEPLWELIYMRYGAYILAIVNPLLFSDDRVPSADIQSRQEFFSNLFSKLEKCNRHTNLRSNFITRYDPAKSLFTSWLGYNIRKYCFAILNKGAYNAQRFDEIPEEIPDTAGTMGSSQNDMDDFLARVLKGLINMNKRPGTKTSVNNSEHIRTYYKHLFGVEDMGSSIDIVRFMYWEDNKLEMAYWIFRELVNSPERQTYTDLINEVKTLLKNDIKKKKYWETQLDILKKTNWENYKSIKKELKTTADTLNKTLHRKLFDILLNLTGLSREVFLALLDSPSEDTKKSLLKELETEVQTSKSKKKLKAEIEHLEKLNPATFARTYSHYLKNKITVDTDRQQLNNEEENEN